MNLDKKQKNIPLIQKNWAVSKSVVLCGKTTTQQKNVF